MAKKKAKESSSEECAQLRRDLEQLSAEMNRLKARIRKLEKAADSHRTDRIVQGIHDRIRRRKSREKVGPIPVEILKKKFPETADLSNDEARPKLLGLEGVSYAPRGLLIDRWLADECGFPPAVKKKAPGNSRD